MPAGSVLLAGGLSGFTARATKRSAVQCRAAVQFSKFQGLGNDFILVNTLPSSRLALTMCRPGVSRCFCRWMTGDKASLQ